MFSSFSPFSVEFLSTPSGQSSVFQSPLLSTEERNMLLRQTDEHNSSRDSSFNTGLPSPSSSGGDEVESPPLKKTRGRNVIGTDGVVYKKPSQSYISIISTAILSKPEKKILLHEIYEFFEQKFPYFKHVESQAWKNSIRHNLSLNECFVKNGRSDNGKGNFWSVHQACVSDFSRGDFRRRQARQRAKRGSFHQTFEAHCNSPQTPHPAETHLYGNTNASGYAPMKSIPNNMSRHVSRQYHPYQQPSCAYPQYNNLVDSPVVPPSPTALSLPNGYAHSYNTLQNSYPAATSTSCLYASSPQSGQDKVPPPNINAAHLAQLGLSGSVSNSRDYFGVQGVRGFMKGYL